MPEVRTECKVFEVDKICDVCGKGKMRNHGFAYSTMPPSYPHICDNEGCGHKEPYLEVRYPHHEFKPKDNK